MKPIHDSRTLYSRLLGYVKPYWRMFALSVVALIVAAATEPLLPAPVSYTHLTLPTTPYV